ncbi:MAG: stage II sporulation protein R [Clostridiales bacterium]|nr:stage II sporulation protein R [Clostridiales bacterium]MDD6936843.1 stage II sporulation protein R [Clostridiales bacterium]MDY2961207.1 stage II sporulation protein R [Oscillospiraceae bacterium]
MEAERKLRPWELALLLALCFTLLCGTWAQGRQQVLAGKLVRLHVIAASDADEAQAVKLQVRDAVLAYLEPKLADVTDVDAAQEIIAANLDGVAQAARTVTPDAVTVTLGPERYPTREYETFSLPAGVYTSLRVTLGAGEGHNWWCVIFPPLCVESSLSDRAVETLSDDDVKLITEDGDGYVLRFRLLELWGKLTERLEK